MATNGQLTLASSLSAATRRRAAGHDHLLPTLPRTGGRTIRIDPIAWIAAGLLATTLLLVAIPGMAAVPAPIAPPTPMAAPTLMTAPAPVATPVPSEAPAVPAPAPAPVGY